MDKSQFTTNHVPGDPQLINTIISEIKSQGIFDEFRRDCLSDVDTKPSLQNLRNRVNTYVAAYLSRVKWSPELNKNQIREKIRKYLNDGGFMDSGVERIVDQVINPKIDTVLVPKVEEVFYNHTGIEVPDDVESEDEHSSDNTANTTEPPKRIPNPQSPIVRAPFRHPGVPFPRAPPNYFYNHPAPHMYPYPNNHYYPVFNPGVLPPKPKVPLDNMTSIPLPPSSGIINKGENTNPSIPGSSYDDTNDNMSKEIEEPEEKSLSNDEGPPGVDDMAMDLDFVLPPGVDDSSSDLDAYKSDAERERDNEDNISLNKISMLNLDTNVNVTPHVDIEKTDVKKESPVHTDILPELPKDSPPAVDEFDTFRKVSHLPDKEEKEENVISIPFNLPSPNLDVSTGKIITECEKKNDNDQLVEDDDDDEISPPFEPLVRGSHTLSSDSEVDSNSFTKYAPVADSDSKDNKVDGPNMIKGDSENREESDEDSAIERSQSVNKRTDYKYRSDDDNYREMCDEYGRYRRRSIDRESEDDVDYRREGRSTHSRSRKKSKKSNKRKKKKEKYCKPDKRDYRRSSDDSDDSSPGPQYRDYYKSRHSRYDRSSSKSNRPSSSSGKSYRSSKTHYEVDAVEPLTKIDTCDVYQCRTSDRLKRSDSKLKNMVREEVVVREPKILLRDLRTFYDIDRKRMLDNNNDIKFKSTMSTEMESKFEEDSKDLKVDEKNDLKKLFSQLQVNLLRTEVEITDGSKGKQEEEEEESEKVDEPRRVKIYLQPDIRNNIEKYPNIEAIVRKELFEEKSIEILSEIPREKDLPEKDQIIKVEGSVVDSGVNETVNIDNEGNTEVEENSDKVERNAEVEETPDEVEGNDDIEETPDEVEGNDDIEETPDEVEGNDDIEETPDEVEGNDDIEETPDEVEGNDDIEENSDEVEGNDDIEENSDEVKEIDDIEKHSDEEGNENHCEKDLGENNKTNLGKVDLNDFYDRLQESRIRKLLRIKRKLIQKFKLMKKRKIKQKVINSKNNNNGNNKNEIIEESKVEKVLELSNNQLIIETDENLKNQIFDIIGVEWKTDQIKSVMPEQTQPQDGKKLIKKRIENIKVKKVENEKIKKIEKRKPSPSFSINENIKKPRIDEKVPNVEEVKESLTPKSPQSDLLPELISSKPNETIDHQPEREFDLVDEENESNPNIPEFTIRKANEEKYKNIRYSNMSNARSTKSGLRILVPRKSQKEIPTTLPDDDISTLLNQVEDGLVRHFNMEDSYVKLKKFEEFVKKQERSLDEIRFVCPEQYDWWFKYYLNAKVSRGVKSIEENNLVTSHQRPNGAFRRRSSKSDSSTDQKKTTFNPNDCYKWFDEMNDSRKAVYWMAAREVKAGKSITVVSETRGIARSTIKTYLCKLAMIEEVKKEGGVDSISEFGKMNGSFNETEVKTDEDESLGNGFSEERTPEELELHLVKRAVEEVLGGMSVRGASARYGVSQRKVRAFIQSTKEEEIVSNGNVGVKIKVEKEDAMYEEEFLLNNEPNYKINGSAKEMEEKKPVVIFKTKKLKLEKDMDKGLTLTNGSSSPLTSSKSNKNGKAHLDVDDSETYNEVAKLVLSGTMSARNAAREYELNYKLLLKCVAHLKLLNGSECPVDDTNCVKPKDVFKTGKTNKDEYELACKEINNGGSFRKTAKKYQLSFHSLYMYHRKRYYGLTKNVNQEEGVNESDIKEETGLIKSKNDVIKEEEINQDAKEKMDVKLEVVCDDKKKKNNLMCNSIYEKASHEVLAGMKIEQAAFVYSIDCAKLTQFVAKMKKKIHSGEKRKEKMECDGDVSTVNEKRTKISKPKTLNQSYESSELYKPKPSFLQSFPRRHRMSTTAS